MSMTQEELNTVLDYQADLDWAISEKDFKKAAEIIFTVEEEGFAHEAKLMSASLQRAYAREWDEFKTLPNNEFMERYYEENDPRDEADRYHP